MRDPAAIIAIANRGVARGDGGTISLARRVTGMGKGAGGAPGYPPETTP